MQLHSRYENPQMIVTIKLTVNIQLARSIIANTDYNRIQRKIIEPLTAPILPFLSHNDDSVISAAGLALSTIISKTSLTSRDNAIQILLKTQSLISPDISIPMQMVLWNVGAVAGANILGYDW